MDGLSRPRDARGRRVRLCQVRDLPREAPEAARREAGAVGRMRLALKVVALLAGVMVALLVIRAATGNLTLDGVLLPVMIVVLAAFNVLALRNRQRLALGVLLESGICPGCGYPLSSARVEEDGCRVCPECGAAWRKGGGAEA